MSACLLLHKTKFIMAHLDIDLLLERYLTLVDEYTKLRSKLNQLQVDIYQNIARANYSAERGIRYGPDLYDERMQAVRQLNIAVGEDNVPSFEIGLSQAEVTDDVKSDSQSNDDGQEKPTQKPKDPLRWFGVLTPMPLRVAQKEAIEAVEDIVPKLVSINAEMIEVEIQVRRQKKRRAKTEAIAMKQRGEEVTRSEVEA
ncbi:hypothetical protein UCRPA7_2213 [Phaeoacremonium minimum UCRPA7]|uniref:Vacuolar ATPase assembly protein VMA22 n=1 Tax=Phaeoacremonium minimum (strain UCR-PA7) TaxID=1286976 RepID=R8BS76_PHAM7|nr:hypothetical protein UCRPA7_2213 [Phaeoacremonium minimum UCRPA7]EOO02217.1 hypothetical protein UCRPA7_2213 [Phaeoacremonium minimum UCRPA7]